jgi:CHASE2 domain-containing sensor protein
MKSPSGICNADYALSTVLANQYLQDSNQKINLPFQDNLQLGGKKSNFLTTKTGAYQWYGSDFSGYQTMLNYRSNKSLIDGVGRISLENFLEMSPEQVAAKVSNKIVLIGTTEVQYSDTDIHQTPYGKVPGIFLQAQMTSQLVSAALERFYIHSSHKVSIDE